MDLVKYADFFENDELVEKNGASAVKPIPLAQTKIPAQGCPPPNDIRLL
jgi:hypothetical protein